MLVGPGAVSLAFTGFGKVALSKYDEIGAAILGLPVTFILCIAVGYILARKTGPAGKVFGLTVLWSFLLMIVNIAIAFGGCVAMDPPMDFK